MGANQETRTSEISLLFVIRFLCGQMAEIRLGRNASVGESGKICGEVGFPFAGDPFLREAIRLATFARMKILKVPSEVILYTRPICGWCQDAKAWLDERGWKFVSRDVGADASARQRAVGLSGQTLVPVIEVDGLVLGDFDVGQLERFLKAHGYLG
jgi:glutaredoxin